MGQNMKYYYKEITRQDVTRSFVVNRKAVLYFFNLALTAHGDEAMIYLRFSENENYQPVRLVLHQDTRILLPQKEFNEGDISFFRKDSEREFTLTIIKKEGRIDTILSYLNKNRYYLSNTKIPM